jgi:hypothetical protein
MDHELTENEIDRICSYLRVIDLTKKHPDEVDSLPQLKDEVEKLSALVKEIMDGLSEEQRDKVLETHKVQSEAIANKLVMTDKKKKKK